MRPIIDSAIKDKRLDHLILSGGEPTLYPHFFDLLEYLASTPLTVGLFTTAERFAQQDFLEAMLKFFPTERLRLTTAIHSFDTEKHDTMTGHRGSFGKTMTGLHNVMAKKIPLSVKYLATKITYRDMESYVRTYFETFPDSVSLQICALDYCGVASDQSEQVKVSFSEWSPHLESALDVVIAHEQAGRKRVIRVLDTPLCAADPYYWKYIKIPEQPVLAVYVSPKDRTARFDVPNESSPDFGPCRKCSVRSICPGTWQSVAQVFDESVFVPISLTKHQTYNH